MSSSRFPEEGELVEMMDVEVMDLDQQIEALRIGVGSPEDPALRSLVDLRDDVDLRTATLLGQSGPAWSDALAAHDEAAAQAPLRPPTQLHRWNRRRLAVLPVAGALVIASTGAAAAFSSSPHSPLFPLHQLIFGSSPSSDAQISRDLTAANNLLDRASSEAFARRGINLVQARFLLVTARDLLPQASSADTRTRFSQQIVIALARATTLSTPPPAAQAVPTPSPSTTEPAERTDAESSGSADPTETESEGYPQSTTPVTGRAPEAEVAEQPQVLNEPTQAPATAAAKAPESESQPTRSATSEHAETEPADH